MIEVELPDGRIVEIDTTDPQIAAGAAKKFLNTSSIKPAQETSGIQNLLQSAGGGVTRGVAAAIGTPRMITEGVEKVTDLVAGENNIPSFGEKIGLPTSDDIMNRFEASRGQRLVEPKGVASEYADRVGQVFPAFLAGGVPGAVATGGAVVGQTVEEGAEAMGVQPGQAEMAGIGAELVTTLGGGSLGATRFMRGEAGRDIAGVNRGELPDAVGSLQGATDKVSAAAKASRSRVSAGFKEAEKDGALTVVKGEYAQDIIENRIKAVTGGLDLTSSLDAKANRALKKIADRDNVTLNDLQDLRKAYSRASRTGSNKAQQNAARDARNVLDQAMRDGFENGNIAGSPEALQKYRKALEGSLQHFKLFESGDTADFVAKMVSGNKTPEEIRQIVLGGSGAGKSRSASRAYDQIITAAGDQGDEVRRILNQTVIQDVIQRAQVPGEKLGTVNPLRVADNIAEIRGNNKSLWSKFSETEQTALQRLERAARAAGKGRKAALPARTVDGILRGFTRGQTSMFGTNQEARSFNEMMRLLGGSTLNAAPQELKDAASAAVRGQKGSIKLPMDSSSRLKRAKELGFDTDNPVFHGTSGNIKSFDGEMANISSQTGVPKNSFFFTSDPENAATYAKRLLDGEYTEEGGNIIKSVLRKGKNLETTVEGRLTADLFFDDFKTTLPNGEEFQGHINELAKMAQENGYESLTVKNIVDTGGGHYSPATTTVVFDPKNIRSVNAKFDPKNRNSSNLLHSTLPLGIGGGIMGMDATKNRNGG